MKLGDVDWKILVRFDTYGNKIRGYEVSGQFHEFEKSVVVPVEFVELTLESSPFERAMRVITHELEIAHSQARGNL